MSVHQAWRRRVKALALELISDSQATDDERAGARASLLYRAPDWSSLSVPELKELRRLRRKSMGQPALDHPVVCLRCAAYTDGDLDDLRAAMLDENPRPTV